MSGGKTIPCKYFPELPARWHCPRCAVNISDPCAKIPRHGDDRYEVRRDCPICLEPIQRLGFGHAIKPFWERIPLFFLYPAKPASLVYLLVLSLLSLIFLANTFIGSTVLILSFYALLVYAFKCLNHVARGYMIAPGLSVSYEVVRFSLISKQMTVYILFGIALGFTASFLGSIGVIAVGIFLLLGLPASTTLLAIHGSVFSAVNPANIFRTITSIGFPYFALYVFLLSMLAGYQMVQDRAVELIPPYLLLPSVLFISGYFTVAMYAMMGYVIYQYHEELGFDQVEVIDEQTPSKPAGLSDDPLLNEIYILNIEGKQDDAIHRLWDAVKRQPKSEYYAKLHKLLQATGRGELLKRFGKDYLHCLLNDNRVSRYKRLHEAALVYLDCQRIDPTFDLDDPQAVCDIGETALQGQHIDVCLAVLRNFHKRFPGSPQLPKAYLLAAKALFEHKQQDAQAIKILDGIIKQYPDHPMIEEIRQYRNVVASITV